MSSDTSLVGPHGVYEGPDGKVFVYQNPSLLRGHQTTIGTIQPQMGGHQAKIERTSQMSYKPPNSRQQTKKSDMRSKSSDGNALASAIGYITSPVKSIVTSPVKIIGNMLGRSDKTKKSDKSKKTKMEKRNKSPAKYNPPHKKPIEQPTVPVCQEPDDAEMEPHNKRMRPIAKSKYDQDTDNWRKVNARQKSSGKNTRDPRPRSGSPIAMLSKDTGTAVELLSPDDIPTDTKITRLSDTPKTASFRIQSQEGIARQAEKKLEKQSKKYKQSYPSQHSAGLMNYKPHLDKPKVWRRPQHLSKPQPIKITQADDVIGQLDNPAATMLAHEPAAHDLDQSSNNVQPEPPALGSQPAIDSHKDIPGKRSNFMTLKNQPTSKGKEQKGLQNKNNHKLATKLRDELEKQNIKNVQKKKTLTEKEVKKSDSVHKKITKKSNKGQSQSKATTKENNPKKSDSFNKNIVQKKNEPKPQRSENNIKQKEPKQTDSIIKKSSNKPKEIVKSQENLKTQNNKTQSNTKPNKIGDENIVRNKLNSFLKHDVDEKEELNQKSYSRKPKKETVVNKANKEDKQKERSKSVQRDATEKDKPIKQIQGLTFDNRPKSDAKEVTSFEDIFMKTLDAKQNITQNEITVEKSLPKHQTDGPSKCDKPKALGAQKESMKEAVKESKKLDKTNASNKKVLNREKNSKHFEDRSSKTIEPGVDFSSKTIEPVVDLTTKPTKDENNTSATVTSYKEIKDKPVESASVEAEASQSFGFFGLFNNLFSSKKEKPVAHSTTRKENKNQYSRKPKSSPTLKKNKAVAPVAQLENTSSEGQEKGEPKPKTPCICCPLEEDKAAENDTSKENIQNNIGDIGDKQSKLDTQSNKTLAKTLSPKIKERPKSPQKIDYASGESCIKSVRADMHTPKATPLSKITLSDIKPQVSVRTKLSFEEVLPIESIVKPPSPKKPATVSPPNLKITSLKKSTLNLSLSNESKNVDDIKIVDETSLQKCIEVAEPCKLEQVKTEETFQTKQPETLINYEKGDTSETNVLKSFTESEDLNKLKQEVIIPEPPVDNKLAQDFFDDVIAHEEPLVRTSIFSNKVRPKQYDDSAKASVLTRKTMVSKGWNLKNKTHDCKSTDNLNKVKEFVRSNNATSTVNVSPLVKRRLKTYNQSNVLVPEAQSQPTASDKNEDAVESIKSYCTNIIKKGAVALPTSVEVTNQVKQSQLADNEEPLEIDISEITPCPERTLLAEMTPNPDIASGIIRKPFICQKDSVKRPMYLAGSSSQSKQHFDILEKRILAVPINEDRPDVKQVSPGKKKEASLFDIMRNFCLAESSSERGEVP